MPRARRIALLEAAAERDFVIVEDDYEFEMSFLQPPTPALKSLDQYGRVLYVGSFSKSLFRDFGSVISSPRLPSFARRGRCAR